MSGETAGQRARWEQLFPKKSGAVQQKFVPFFCLHPRYQQRHLLVRAHHAAWEAQGVGAVRRPIPILRPALHA